MTDTSFKIDSSRISILDILRGFALYGILLAHAATIYLLELPIEGKDIQNETDLIIKTVLNLFIERKFYLIFSFLFGLSFYIQFRNAEKRGHPFTIKFIWRLFILFVIGILHHQFYPFDILHIYAIMGLLLIPIRRLEKKYLLIVTVIIISAATVFSEFGHQIKSSSSMTLMADLGFPQRIIHQLSSGHFLMILGLFYFGYWVGLTGIFDTNDIHPDLALKITLFCTITLFLTVLIGSSIYNDITLGPLKSLSLSFCYIGIICLLYAHGGKKKFIWIALENLGRMGLTNYVLQTLFFFALFEFAYENIRNGQLLSIVLIANLFYFIQIAFSIFWFKKFKFGPLEWLWRSTTNLYKTATPANKGLRTIVEQDVPFHQ
ncbi:DUF418 domain-containing protein [Olivibacter sp. CPCC 100613]|uniref:DUF418 domain-containing protein n=1 Tax=Olivibacter sp. CPCC 100613 TaxID=3079931 RepID=UPI002FFD40E8